jgi:hypothetical protein
MIDSEPIHTWFGLSYSSHLVLDQAVTGRLPVTWQLKMAVMLDQLNLAFPDVDPRGHETLALAGQQWECGELDDVQMAAIGMATSEGLDHSACGCDPEPDEDHEADDAARKRYVAWQDQRWDCERDRTYWYDWRGDEHQSWERVVVPTETEQQARAADRIVLSRTLLQSMPQQWQEQFVTLMEQVDDVDDAPESYDIRFYTPDGLRITDPIPAYSRGRTRLVPNLAALA